MTFDLSDITITKRLFVDAYTIVLWTTFSDHHHPFTCISVWHPICFPSLSLSLFLTPFLIRCLSFSQTESERVMSKSRWTDHKLTTILQPYHQTSKFLSRHTHTFLSSLSIVSLIVKARTHADSMTSRVLLATANPGYWSVGQLNWFH